MRISPTVLAALLVAVVGAGLISARKLLPVGRWSGPTVVALLLFVLAAFGPTLACEGGARSCLLVDVSASTGTGIPDLKSIGGAAGLDPKRCRVVLFARSGVELPGEDWPVARREDVIGAGPGETDLAGALIRVASTLDRGDEVVVATDGRVDVAAAAEAAARLRSSGIGLRIRERGRRIAGDLRLDRIEVASRVAKGASVVLGLEVAGPPSSDYDLRIAVDGRTARRESRRTGPAGRETFRTSVGVLGSGYHELAAEVVARPRDVRPENDRRAAGVVVGGPARVTLVNADGLAAPLERMGFAVTLAPADRRPDRLSSDLLIVRDTEAVEFGDEGAAVREFVAGGGGLLLLGGPRTFGPGGYSGRPIEDCLPLRCASEDGPLLVVVLLDCSGTMQQDLGGVPKLTAAKGAILDLAAAMGPKSILLVVAFREDLLLSGGAGIRMGGKRAVDRVAEWLASISRGRGGTALLPPLNRALEVAGRLKDGGRILTMLVTDGRLEEESPDRVFEVGAALRRAGGESRFAALAIGRDADLDLLAKLVGSPDRVRHVTESGALEEAFIENLLRVEGEGQVLHGEMRVEAVGSEDAPYVGGLPDIRGLTRTARKDGAELWYATPGGHPVVAGWRYGLGRAAALATDPLGGWAPGWGETGLLPALASWLARPGDLRGARVSASPDRGRLRIRAHCEAKAARLRGTLLIGGGRSVPVELVQDGPRTYLGVIEAPEPAPARLTFSGGGATFDGGLEIPYSREYRESGVDHEALDRLRSLIAEDPASPIRRVPAAPWIALLGVLFLLLGPLSRARRFCRVFLKMRMPEADRESATNAGGDLP